MLRISLSITILVLGLCIRAKAQDPMFTQFFAASLELNPALTGAIDGSFRLSALYRDQWGGLLDNPWQTYGVMGDLRFRFSNRSNSDFAGAGVEFLADRVALFDFNTTGIKLSGAYHKFLSERGNQYLSGGLYIGILQRNINVEALEFGDQFNGLDGYSLGTLEDLPSNNFGYFDIGLGLNYSASPSDVWQLTVGGSLAHINTPSASFYFRTPEQEDALDIPLYMRWTVYASSIIALNDAVDLLPRVLVMGQSSYFMTNIGANVRFNLNKYETSAMHLGGGIQVARDLESLAPSAAYLFAGIEIGRVLLGFSYDMHLDDLTNERVGQGVFEFSITYIGEYDNTSTFCPTF